LCADVYVKVYMLYKGQRVNRKQTRGVACGVVAPSVAVFNESFLFDVESRQSLADITVELVLIDCHRVTKDNYIGRLVVNPFDHGDRWAQPPAEISDARGPHAGFVGDERPAVRPVAVWHRLAATAL